MENTSNEKPFVPNFEEMQEKQLIFQKNQRNQLLEKTDKYTLPDFPITPEQLSEIKEYRQMLRDYFASDEVKNWTFSFENQQPPDFSVKPSFLNV